MPAKSLADCHPYSTSISFHFLDVVNPFMRFHLYLGLPEGDIAKKFKDMRSFKGGQTMK